MTSRLLPVGIEMDCRKIGIFLVLTCPTAGKDTEDFIFEIAEMTGSWNFLFLSFRFKCFICFGVNKKQKLKPVITKHLRTLCEEI